MTRPDADVPCVGLSDAALCALTQDGDSRAVDALMHRYERLAAGCALHFFFPGGDQDDVRQEARIGLLRAIQMFDPARGVPFRLYAKLSIDKQLITALKASRRFKHRLLNESVRIAIGEQDESIDIGEVLASPLCRDPHVVYVEKERLTAVLAGVRSLTPLERRSVIGRANGLTYVEIAESFGGASHKSIDNATQRARLKLRHAA